MKRSTNCLSKLDRMRKTLRHQEADRVPVSDFFWGSFLRRWRDELGLPADTDIYRYYDLDWMNVNPNLDPHIKPFEILRENEQEVLVRTGFEAVIRKRLDLPMPAFLEFDTNTVEKMEAFQFDDPWDERRYFRAGDDQINGVGDGFSRNTAPFVGRIEEAYSDFPVFGGVLEANEMLTRLIGPENSLQWMALEPDAMGRFIARIFEFSLAILKAQIKAADGKLDGMVIWGDVAYKKGLLFSPVFWRKHFKPGVKALVDECHSHDLPVIYHGCGNVNKIFADFAEIGVDAYNPLEAKAGMDVIDLRRRFGHQIGFCGNMDVQLWATGTLDEIKAAALTKLNAAKGGGFIFQSDHSVPNDISGEKYDFVVKLIRECGKYPLQLGEYDLAMS
jgi:uroporphyrinogen decarboxylase